jgi:hypothetical protein
MSLAKYSESRQTSLVVGQNPVVGPFNHTFDEVSSTLFLHIQAAADYYTMNHSLMNDVPPVFVDIILDPYIFNAVPQSLLPTAAYIIVLAIGGWYLSKYINGWVRVMAESGISSAKKES